MDVIEACPLPFGMATVTFLKDAKLLNFEFHLSVRRPAHPFT